MESKYTSGVSLRQQMQFLHNNVDQESSEEGDKSVFADAQRDTIANDLLESVLDFDRKRNQTEDDFRLLPH